MDALRSAVDTAWYQDGDTLWVKVVAQETAGGGGPFGAFGSATSVTVKR